MELSKLLDNAINPLHKIMIIAISLNEVMKNENNHASQKILPELELSYSDQFEMSEFETKCSGKSIYPTKEIAGVAGLFEELKIMGHKVIFSNDFSLDIHGIDAVAYDNKNSEYIICEAKGTSLAKIKSFSSYLKQTKNKGRQLSNEWCWASLVDYAFHGATSGIFLKLLEPILKYKVKRLLCVSRLEAVHQGYVIVNKRIWLQEEMMEKSWFSKSYDLSKQLKFYEEIINDINLNNFRN